MKLIEYSRIRVTVILGVGFEGTIIILAAVRM